MTNNAIENLNNWQLVIWIFYFFTIFVLTKE